MYTLRIIESERNSKDEKFHQVIENFSLGEAYTVIKNGDSDEFNKILDDLYPSEGRSDIRMLLLSENKKEFFIMKNSENRVFDYFIMIGNGQTFERL